MSSLYLVRHGQASFGADDYDVLSATGAEQCRRLGAWLHARGHRFQAVYTGTLRRHRESLAAIAQALPGLPDAAALPALDEYDSAAVVAAIHPGPLERPTTPELYRHHFRLLRQGLARWMAGEVQPAGMPSYAEFRDGVVRLLERVRREHDGRVLVVSSGGPISTAVGHVLATPAATTIELNMRIRNSALTEFAYTPKRHMLLTYNTLPHLDDPALAGLVTYA